MSRSEAVTLPLTIQLLGRMAIYAHGAPLVPLRSRKGMWLVALLALRARQEVSREWLAVTLWPDSDDPLATLRRTLTDLRQALGPVEDYIETLPGRKIRLALPDDAIDVLKFDRLAAAGELTAYAEALALYRGPLLEDCDEEWAVTAREARLGAFLNMAEQAADLLLQQRRPAEAVAYLRAAVAAAPLRESLCCTLMQALALGGQSSDAILEYHQLRQRLRRELNAEPSAATVACYRQILSEGRQRVQAAETRRTVPVDTASSLFRVPHPLTDLIGREPELRAMETGFTRSRLVTLTGSGGIGKTRLAIEAAQRRQASYPDGVWFVELVRVTAPALIAQTITTTLRVREAAERSPLETLTDFLSKRTALLVLDNCEHLIEACASLVETLLHHCPQLSILATSRQPLNLSGEVRVSVPPLDAPPLPGNELHADLIEKTLQDSSAVRLFVARASTALPGFRLTWQNLPAIALLCRQLEGIPLALEMAAVRVKVMSVEQISARLKDRFRLLTTGSRPDLPHHQTLRSLIDWSHDLLSLPERVLLRRLSVFAGGWTLEAAEAVCANAKRPGEADAEASEDHDASCLPPEDVMDLLGMLVEKSLVQSEEEANGERWFRMLETLREYAQERMDAADETGQIKRRHRDYFMQVAGEAHAQMQTPEQRFWLEILDREYENLCAALNFCRLDTDSGEAGLYLASRLGDYWWIRGYMREGRTFLDAALEHPGGRNATAVRAQAMGITGVLASYQADYVSAERSLQASVALQRSLGDKRQVAIVLGNLGSVYRDMGRYDESIACLEESLALCRETNLIPNAAITLTNLGGTIFQKGDYALARQRYEEGVALRRQLGNPRGVAIAQCGLGQVLMHIGELEEALNCFKEAETVFREMNDRGNLAITLHSIACLLMERKEFRAASEQVAEALEVCGESEDLLNVVLLRELAQIYLDLEDAQRATQFLGAAQAYADRYGMNLRPSEQEKAETLRRELRERLGESAFLSAWREGSGMSLETAMAL
ncbi:MAG TPA: tetratricopeptide repeat protein, partial [Chthonomonadaceae bacterium]|nr:tetratricopeptide repeat protein [Chthonomonadaceae bacterium]